MFGRKRHLEILTLLELAEEKASSLRWKDERVNGEVELTEERALGTGGFQCTPPGSAAYVSKEYPSGLIVTLWREESASSNPMMPGEVFLWYATFSTGSTTKLESLSALLRTLSHIPG